MLDILAHPLQLGRVRVEDGVEEQLAVDHARDERGVLGAIV